MDAAENGGLAIRVGSRCVSGVGCLWMMNYRRFPFFFFFSYLLTNAASEKLHMDRVLY